MPFDFKGMLRVIEKLISNFVGIVDIRNTSLNFKSWILEFYCEQKGFEETDFFPSGEIQGVCSKAPWKPKLKGF